MVIPARDVITSACGREGARQRQNFQAMLRKFQISDDLGSQKADHIREFCELEPGDDLFCDRRPADEMSALEHNDFPARACQICRGNESVVSTANDDCIVIVLCHGQFPLVCHCEEPLVECVEQSETLIETKATK